jgi:hypothetical protein
VSSGVFDRDKKVHDIGASRPGHHKRVPRGEERAAVGAGKRVFRPRPPGGAIDDAARRIGRPVAAVGAADNDGKARQPRDLARQRQRQRLI